MVRRSLGLIAAVAVAGALVALPAAAQDTGYNPPTPLPTFGETEFPSPPPSDDPSDPPPTVPPGPPPSESEPPPTVPPGPPPSDPPPDVPPNDPPDDPKLPATGLGVTNGMATAGAFLLGGTGLVLAARRRRRPQG